MNQESKKIAAAPLDGTTAEQNETSRLFCVVHFEGFRQLLNELLDLLSVENHSEFSDSGDVVSGSVDVNQKAFRGGFNMDICNGIHEGTIDFKLKDGKLFSWSLSVPSQKYFVGEIKAINEKNDLPEPPNPKKAV